MLTTADIELLQQFYHAAEIGDVANALSAALISHGGQPTK